MGEGWGGGLRVPIARRANLWPPVKLVGTRYRTRFRASSGNSDSANWPECKAAPR